MSNVGTWTTNAPGNSNPPPDGWPEGQAPSSVNDCARENMAAMARLFKDTNGSLTTTGTGTAYVLTTNSAHATLAAQPLIVAEINTDSGASPTLNVDSLGAKAIIMPDGTAPATGALVAGAIAIWGYEAGADSYVLIAGSKIGVVASQAEAEAGTDNTVAMTPLRTAQAIIASLDGDVGPDQKVLTDAATITWDLETAPTAFVTITTDRTLGTPSNIKRGHTYLLIVGQGPGGSHEMTWPAVINWGDIGEPILPTAAGMKCVVTLVGELPKMLGSWQSGY